MDKETDDWVRLNVPPGLFRMGTEYQSAGRWWDADLVRWFGGMRRPVGGWASKSATAIAGVCRWFHTWRDNSGNSHGVFGSTAGLFHMDAAGVVSDITPSGWVAADVAASTWTMDNGGERLVMVNDETGDIYKWDPGDVTASLLANAPQADALFVTDEGICMTLAAEGNPRRIYWSDVRDFEEWNRASFTNLAGDLDIQTPGELMAGMPVRGGFLLHTTEDLHLGRYYGLPDVYGVEWVAGDCGIISKGAVIGNGTWAIWMGVDNFYSWRGLMDTLPCDIHDAIFGATLYDGTANPDQIDLDHGKKVRAVHVAEFSEVWWFYPTGAGAGSENNRAAVYNYREGHWNLHRLNRSCGAPRGDGWKYPIMIDPAGSIFDHEKGFLHPGAERTPFMRSGPIELGNGKRVLELQRVIPDTASPGDVEVRFFARYEPGGTEYEHGPYSAAAQFTPLFSARQVAMELRQVNASDWRIGDYRAEVFRTGEF